MSEFLIFMLAAPLGAMGEIAVGERRGSWDHPGRSAVLGLIAACLGLDREDETAHADLESGYSLALRREHIGPLLADYHTVQVPPRQRGRQFATRAEELAANDLETIVSRRDYRTDLIIFAALWTRPAARWPLTEISAAMRAPHFMPYFGRKSCPLMLPMAPDTLDAMNPVIVLAARATAFLEWARGQGLWPLAHRKSPVVTMDADEALSFGLPILRVEPRRDSIISRRRWQFGLRNEAVLAEVPAP